MNDLLENAGKIHTTELGMKRIKKNLDLLAWKDNDVVRWCREQTLNADTITRTGKNWYVYAAGSIITINASSFTIITAHRIKGAGKE